MTKKPVAGAAPKKGEQSPDAGSRPEPRLWSFSFRFFRQEKYFGIGGTDAAWFAAVLDKFAELSRKTISELKANPSEKLQWRNHDVDWNRKNVPYARKDLKWIDKEYLDNSEEYPIEQFQITTGLGRVIGFFDELKVFNIIFFDPMHNMQPSSFSDFKLRPTSVTESHSAGIIRYVEAQLGVCTYGECSCRAAYGGLQKIAANNDGGTTLLVHMPAELFVRVAKCVEDGVANSVAELIDATLHKLEN